MWAESASPRATGRALLVQLIRDLVPGAEVAFSTVCARCGADHGPPVAIGLPVSVSVSYAGSMVAVGVVHDRDAASLGIDIEAVRAAPGGPMAELAPLFAPHPPPDLRGWTMIEAVLKADGRGLRVPPSDVVFDVPGGAGASVLGGAAVLADVPGRTEQFEVASGPGPDGFVLSVAVLPGPAGAARGYRAMRGTARPAARR